jgi:cobalt-zinc-cadmium efflux system membrane fusion protein
MHHYFLKLSLVALLTSAVMLAGCKKSQPTQTQPNNQDLNIVVANDALMAQIKVAEVDQVDVSDILRVAGQIDFDEQALTRIGASVTGRIT